MRSQVKTNRPKTRAPHGAPEYTERIAAFRWFNNN